MNSRRFLVCVFDLLRPVKSAVPAVITFGLASALGVALVAARCVIAGRPTLLYLPFNLFLAWIPFCLALGTVWLVESRPPKRLLALGGGLVWLIFFPNAPYICTDMMHLTRWHPAAGVPLWFDLVVNLTFAVTGLFLGFASLALMHRVVSETRGIRVGWVFALTALALASFGIYLGRFWRWNSVDVFLAPWALVTDFIHRFGAPWNHSRLWGFSTVCFLFLVLGYLMCGQFGELRFAPRQKDTLNSDGSGSLPRGNSDRPT